MRIKGIGTISKEKAMEILTREGKEAVKTFIWGFFGMVHRNISKRKETQ